MWLAGGVDARVSCRCPFRRSPATHWPSLLSSTGGGPPAWPTARCASAAAGEARPGGREGRAPDWPDDDLGRPMRLPSGAATRPAQGQGTPAQAHWERNVVLWLVRPAAPCRTPTPRQQHQSLTWWPRGRSWWYCHDRRVCSGPRASMGLGRRAASLGWMGGRHRSSAVSRARKRRARPRVCTEGRVRVCVLCWPNRAPTAGTGHGHDLGGRGRSSPSPPWPPSLHAA